VLLIQVVAATLLVLGSALIFRALLAMDLADRPRSAPQPRIVRRLRREAAAGSDDATLPRAA
jgi:hypothetical protein